MSCTERPLPVHTKIWTDISMDFIKAFPPPQGKTMLFMVVDRLSKYAHFVPLSHPFTASQVPQVFLDDVYKLHVYGQAPNVHLPYLVGTSVVKDVDRTMHAREQAIAMFQPYLIIAKVGEVAYKLQFLDTSQIHYVFHVSQLKLCKGTNHQVEVLPQCGLDRVLSVEPKAIIRRSNYEKTLYAVSKIEDWKILEDIKRNPYSKRPPIRRSADREGVIEKVVTKTMADRLWKNMLIKLEEIITRNNAFSGTNGEDVVERIENFLKTVDPLDLPNVSYERLRLAVFPISLTGDTSEWLMNEPQSSVTTWVDLMELFFGKYYPPSHTGKIVGTKAKWDSTNVVFEN
ncbi:retrotransposable element Tf2 [Tanacetum coccineum]